MTVTHNPNEGQAIQWNGLAGHAWVEKQELLDQMFRPFQDLLTEAVKAESATQVLDIGCGTGAITLAIARQLGSNGRSVGIDISDVMIAAARKRIQSTSTAVQFICADAQTHRFEPSSFDMIVSRFGVMFFDNPVETFTRLRKVANDNAELRFIAWLSAKENSFMTTAERAAGALLPNIPARQAHAPGQFAFADEDRVRSILEKSDWAKIHIRPIDVPCTFPEKELVGFLMRLGPIGRILHDVDEQTHAQVIRMVREAFEPFVHGSEVRFNAACWLVSARVYENALITNDQSAESKIAVEGHLYPVARVRPMVKPDVHEPFLL